MARVAGTCLLVVLTLLGAWYLANPQAWEHRGAPHAYQDDPPAADSMPDHTVQVAQTAPPSASPASPQPLTPASTDESTVESRRLPAEFMLGQACIAPVAAPVTRKEEAVIYRWVDAAGQTHFSDTPPPDSQAGERYTPGLLPTPLDYFDLSLEYRGKGTPGYLQNELVPQVTGIYRTLTGLLGQERLRKVALNLMVFPDRGSYLDHATAYTGRDMSSTGGFYSPMRNEAFLYEYPAREDTLRVARHESTHVLVRGMLGLAPPWLNEGLAEYFSTIEVREQYASVTIDPAVLRQARSVFMNARYRSLSGFLGQGSNGWQGAGAGANYAVAWSFMYFLMDTREGRSALAGLLRTMADTYCTELDAPSLLAEAWPGGLAQMDRDFRTWLSAMDVRAAHIH